MSMRSRVLRGVLERTSEDRGCAAATTEAGGQTEGPAPTLTSFGTCLCDGASAAKWGHGRSLCALLALLGLLVPSVFAALATPKSESWPVPPGLPDYAVLRVIDGDTIEVEGLGTVRYIGVDTPETKHPQKPVERMGQEAYEANRRLVEGKRVKLEFDVEQRDRYGRVLAYVYVGTTFVNAWLVEAGYAQVMTVPPNVKYAELFLELEREAWEAKRGLWAEDDDVEPPVPGQVYWASAKSDKFHYPWCTWAKEIKQENLVVFESREEAVEAGYVPCKVCKP